ncbi:shikimate kinase [Microbacterium koreense]|uniref:Shikimate kinase n=1 Tax=Microbacterium koreense TaxID=323761 RepID=A0ABW2ZSC9_9MICO
MGAGKTSIGRRVARATDLSFTDSDAVIVREHGPIDEIFRAHGEAHFRSIERAVVAECLADRGVVSLGGGAVLDPATQRALTDHRVVLLTVHPRVVAGRIRHSSRPLLNGPDALERWTSIYEQRRPVYESLADVTFDTSSGPLSDVVTAIADWVRSTEGTS